MMMVVLILPCIFLFSCNKDENKPLFGVWWWDNRLSDEYLDFASENGINEIYYYTSDFSQKNAQFIGRADGLGIKVYWLCGDYQWIDDINLFYQEMEKFENFQNNNVVKFAGVHLDVEPHQHPQWDNSREKLIEKYIDFVRQVTEKYDDICFDFDIPFWLEDEISYDGQTKEAYKFVFDYADRVFVMSYRDSAQNMADVAKEELLYAAEIDKTIFLSAETGEEEDIVTYFEEGKSYLNSQLEQLRDIVKEDFGIAIHHIKSWYNLKE